ISASSFLSEEGNGETLAELCFYPQISETSPTPPPPELRRRHRYPKWKTELTTTSWKCDNGTFKSGYGKHLKKMLHEKIPGCDLKANPHIESRVKLLKRQYFAIVKMMGTAGSEFGWNDKDKMIVSHLNATGLYNKLFSHFEELGIAFGRDRAQGGNAENVTQAVATMEAEREATLSDRQVNENTQILLAKAEIMLVYTSVEHEPPTPGVPAAPGASAAPSSSTAPRAERRMKLMTLLRDAPGLSGDDRMTAGLSILRDNSLIDM
ncbi:hypothetical protein S83_039231, partial [Arachis hypogaea]